MNSNFIYNNIEISYKGSIHCNIPHTTNTYQDNKNITISNIRKRQPRVRIKQSHYSKADQQYSNRESKAIKIRGYNPYKPHKR